jgi:hypothetical protein
MFAFSSLFSSQFISGSFDDAIERDAANGRVNTMLTNALENAYGLALPAAPVQALKMINEFLGLAKAPKLAHGPGAKAHAPAVAQALYSLAQALHSAGKVKGLPPLVGLPDWANPEKLEAKAKAAAEKRQVTKARKAAAEKHQAIKAAKATVIAPPATVDEPTTHTAETPTLNISQHITIVVAAIKGGYVSAKNLAILRAVLETAQPAPEKHNKPITTKQADSVTLSA